MIEHGYIVVRPPASSVVWPNFWQPVHPDSMPHAQLVWAYIPEMGNDDDGYGFVIPARYDMSARQWTDLLTGEEIRPVFWATMYAPEIPFLQFLTPEEAVRRSAAARENVVNRTGPFSRR